MGRVLPAWTEPAKRPGETGESAEEIAIVNALPPHTHTQLAEPPAAVCKMPPRIHHMAEILMLLFLLQLPQKDRKDFTGRPAG